ncbi:MAG: hypothetical protein OXF50_19510 [Caldilineaceae bacterium]|nr:hypothetical protein [Caldilineaceae bacterium]
MSTINTMEDLIRVLDEHPEWLEALRARLLSRELLDLPQNFAMFVAEMREFKSEMNEFKAQMDRFVAATNSRFDGADVRFDGVDARLDRVDTRFDGVDARFDGVDARFDEVDARLARVDARFDEVDARLDRVDARFDEVDARFARAEARSDGHDVMFKRITDDLGQLKGAHARNVALADAAVIARDLNLRRTKNLTQDELLDLIDSADTSDILVSDLRSFRVADLIMEATAEDGEVCYVAVEISYTANGRDTKRALRNAEFMTRFTGKRAFAVVSGLYRDDRIQDIFESGELFWHQLTPEQLEAE